MVKWTCPFCEGELYSACQRVSYKWVKCNHCGKKFSNDHHEIQATVPEETIYKEVKEVLTNEQAS